MANIQKELLLTQEYVKEIFDYRDGFLYWKKLSRMNLNGLVKVGDKAGWFFQHHSGLRYCVRVKGYSFYGARIIFFMHHGYFPEVVDHIDRNPENNKIENLREATGKQNSQNRKGNKNTSSKYKGVSLKKSYTTRWVKTTGQFKTYYSEKWYAYISEKEVTRCLGYFKTEKEAALAFNEAAKRIHGIFAFLNIID